jgi:hypothetical protein
MLIRNALARRVGLALGLCALAAVPVSADYDNGYGYLRAVEGSATLMQAGSGTRTPAELNQPVLAGDRLWVPARSRVEIVLADRNLLRIDGGSEVALERLAASPDSRDRGTVLRLIEGNLQLVVVRESLGDELPRIDTPNATIYVQDYGVFRVAADQEIFTELVVRRGRAEVVTDRRSEVVNAEEQAFVEGDSRLDVESAGSYDNLERWARRLDEEGDVDSRYLGKDLRYAGAPLSRHGSWIDIEGSHYWRPRVATGWRPYWNGRWAYTPSGHTWVSYDPWGWVPHHYGSWDYFPSYGWVWQPGYRWAPAWVYWYQGPSYTGWCPTGYYTRYYGSRWGHGFGFRHGIYGWAGGDWGGFGHWTFVSSDYWRGYRHGYRDGRHDDWRNQRNVQRYAVPIDELRRRGPLDRGVITTDSRPLTPDVLQDPRRAVRVLSEDPTARRGRADGQLPDVNDFIARRPELDPNVRRAVVADRDINQLDGTPLRPETLGRGDRGGRAPDGARSARELPGDRAGTEPDREPGRPRVIIGDGDRPGARQSPGTEGSARAPRAGRPSAGDAGGAPRPGRAERQDGDDGGVTSRSEPRGGVRRPEAGAPGGSVRPDRGVRALPRNDDRSDDRNGGQDGSPAGARERGERTTRPAPSDPGGAPRPDRGVRSLPRDNDGDSASPRSSGRERPSYSRPEPNDRRVYEPRPSERPAPRSTDRGGAERPSPRVYERPAPPSSSRGGYERPSSPRTSERPAPPSSSRGGYASPSRPEPRVAPRSTSPSSGRSSSGSSARPAPERRPSERGSSSSGSSGGRSSGRRASPRDGGQGDS